jgi:hypothetical protein
MESIDKINVYANEFTTLDYGIRDILYILQHDRYIAYLKNINAHLSQKVIYCKKRLTEPTTLSELQALQALLRE